jgi:hypothetical protein
MRGIVPALVEFGLYEFRVIVSDEPFRRHHPAPSVFS